MGKYYIVLFLLLILGGCNDALPPLVVNPYDPQASNFIGDPAGQFSFETLSGNLIKISWAKGSTNGIGFQLERTNLNTNVSVDFIIDKGKKYFVDSSVVRGSSYRYRISTRTSQTDYPIFTDSIKITYDFYPNYSMLANADNYLISGDGHRIINNLFNIYEINNNTIVYLKQLNIAPGNFYILSYDGKYLPYALSGRLSYYDIDNGINIVLRNSSTDNYNSLCMSRDNKYIVSLQQSGLIEIWDLKSGILSKTLANSIEGLSNLILSPDNRFITASDGNYIYIWDFNTLTLYAEIPSPSSYGHSNYIYNNVSSELIFYAEGSSSINFWDINLKNIINNIPGNGKTIKNMNIFDSGEFFVVLYLNPYPPLQNSNNHNQSTPYFPTTLIFWELLNNKPMSSFSPFLVPTTCNNGIIEGNGNILILSPTSSLNRIYWLGSSWGIKYY